MLGDLVATAALPTPHDADPAGGAQPGKPAGPALTFTRDDRDWSMRLYSLFARGGDDERMFSLVVPGDPWSKSRPRFAHGGRTYQPRDDRDAEATLRAALSVGVRPPAFVGNVMIACRFYRSNKQRVDTDNLLKHVCDSATGVLWVDDSQVTLVLGELHLDREFPRTVIVVGNHASTMLRGTDDTLTCRQCGEQYHGGGRDWKRRVTCSAACTRAARGLPDIRALVPCPQCSTPFRRHTSRQKFCSIPCARLFSVGRPKPPRASM